MVHTGFSRGCEPCRKRRLACDQTTPECDNCTTQGLSCSGYRDSGGFLFKDQSARVIKNGTQRHTRRSTASGSATTKTGTVTINDQSREDPRIHLLIASATGCGAAPKDPGLLLFLETYTLFKRGPTPSQAHFNALVDFYQTADPSSPVAAVLSQVNGQLSSLYRGITYTSHCQLQSRIRASTAIREALSDPLQCQKNEVLLALILLDLGERIDYARSSDASHVGHHNAAVALISSRAPESFQDDLSQILLDAARHSAIRKALWGIEEDLDLSVFTRAQNRSARTHFTALDCIISDTLDLRMHVTAFLRGRYKFCLTLLDKLRSACQSQETQIMYWVASVPAEWQPVTQSNTSLETLSLSCDLVEIYTNYETAFLYNQARCIQLMLLGIMHRLSIHGAVFDAAVSADITQMQMKAKARTLCDAVLSSAPCLFGPSRDARVQAYDRNRKASSKDSDVVVDEQQLLMGFPIGARLGHWNLFEILQWMLRILDDEEFGINVDEKVTLAARNFVAKLWF